MNERICPEYGSYSTEAGHASRTDNRCPQCEEIGLVATENGEYVGVDLNGVEKTGRSVEGMEVVEVSLMVQVAEKQRSEFKGWVYPDKVELKSDPDKANLHPDELRDLMGQVADEWRYQFSD